VVTVVTHSESLASVFTFRIYIISQKCIHALHAYNSHINRDRNIIFYNDVLE
jgi:hypothetical protein